MPPQRRRSSLKIRLEQMRVGRVIEEDENWVTLEVAKNDLVKYHVEDGDRFYTLLFVQSDGKGDIKADFPWGDQHV